MFTIYQITNTLNGHSYIGFTQQPPTKRLREHINNTKQGVLDYHLYRAMRKYGIKNFSIAVLEEGWDPKTGKDIREPYWISVLNPEYNMTKGGDGVLGYRHTESERAEASKRSKSQFITPMSSETRTSISNTLKLRNKITPRTLKHRMALSVAKKGIPLSLKHRTSLLGVKKSKITLGKTPSPETKELLRKINSRRVNCTHCNKIGGISAMHRWHFDNCKMKRKA